MWGQKKCAVAHPVHVSNTHTKFGWILSNGLGGDSVTDGGDCNIHDAFLKKRGDNNQAFKIKGYASSNSNL